MKFGLRQLKKPTPKKVKKVGIAIRSFLALLAAEELIHTRPYIASLLLMLAGFIDTIIIPLFGEEEPKL